MKDPGKVTARWIEENKNRDWKNKERERVKEYLKMKLRRRQGESKAYRHQLSKIKTICRKKGVRI